jgi:methylenetetrahydrofolate reductase (NADPH)
MRIRDRLFGSEPCFSFEFFPPRDREGEAQLLRANDELLPLDPDFVSITYGPAGSTRVRTVDLARRLSADLGLEVMAHLTCVGHTADELREVLADLEEAGIENVLALRGDPPRGQATFTPTPGGFAHASDLVRFIRAEGFRFCLGGACYPEGHLEAPSREADLRHLKEKVAAGLDYAITQLFFDNAFYFDFVERCRRAGIHVPIVPGIMPLTNYDQVERFTRGCGATIPRRLQLEAERHRDDPAAVARIGIAHAVAQCEELLARGAPGIHFYTLNRSPAARLTLSALRGIAPEAVAEARP